MIWIKKIGSLTFALFLIGGLAALLAISTFAESWYGTPFAQKIFYQAGWFDLFLVLVWLNIFCATLSRWPFQKHHLGFVVTHIGILTFLVGCLLTRLSGQEGQMSLFEKEQQSRILQSGFALQISSQDKVLLEKDLGTKKIRRDIPLSFSHRLVQMTLDAVIPQALVRQSAEESAADDSEARPALSATLSSESIGLNQAILLMLDDPSNQLPASESLGPATFDIQRLSSKSETTSPKLRLKNTQTGTTHTIAILPDQPRHTLPNSPLTIENLRYYAHARIQEDRIVNQPEKIVFNPAVEFEIVHPSGLREHHTRFMLFPDFESLRGGAKNNHFDLHVTLEVLPPVEGLSAQPSGITFYIDEQNQWHYQVRTSKNPNPQIQALKIGESFQTGWMDMKLTVHEAISHARPKWHVTQDPLNQSENAAVQISYLSQKAQKNSVWVFSQAKPVWIAIGDTSYKLALLPKSLPLHFQLQLKDFRKVDYPGTQNPSSFESDVVLLDPHRGVRLEKTIRMNQPLEYDGWRIFQSSFFQDPEAGEGSVFTIAKNPGIWLIYPGAVILFTGVVILFYFGPKPKSSKKKS